MKGLYTITFFIVLLIIMLTIALNYDPVPEAKLNVEDYRTITVIDRLSFIDNKNNPYLYNINVQIRYKGTMYYFDDLIVIRSDIPKGIDMLKHKSDSIFNVDIVPIIKALN